MNTGRSILSQVLDLVDRKTLFRLVKRYDAESRVTVSRIFTESLYRIPDYQRGYAWGTDQLLDFLEKRWKLTIGDREQKTRALGLKFLE